MNACIVINPIGLFLSLFHPLTARKKEQESEKEF